jgi:hypothetical protein
MARAGTTSTAENFSIGDRVSRYRLKGDKSKGFYTGEIVAVRVRPEETTLYDVRWDHRPAEIDKGYLAIGLSREFNS